MILFVTSDRLAQLGLIALDIEDIIDNLKRQTNPVAVADQPALGGRFQPGGRWGSQPRSTTVPASPPCGSGSG